MGRFLYQIFIRLYPSVIRLVSPFNQKARLWIKGRNKVFNRMKEVISTHHRIIWMHCSSLGEFEQGRPMLEKIRSNYPSYKILLTFFSPSGYEVKKNYDGADYVFYLPIDSSTNAKMFYDIVQPKLIVFVKYEFWYYYLFEAKRRNIPILLISAIFRKNQPFFTFYGSLHRKMLACFTQIFVQNSESVSLLQSIGLSKNVTLSGDTRFDRVIEIAESFQPIPLVQNFCKGADVIVAGSTWLEDDKELSHYANTKTEVKFIIAPHNIGKNRLHECLRLYKRSVLFSSLYDSIPSNDINTVIIDNIGMLSKLYKYSKIAFVGGGFGADGVHNVLEAAVFGKPVVFGPEYEKFAEAIELIDRGGGISVETALELEKVFDGLLKNTLHYSFTAKASVEYVFSKRGATESIMKFIYAKRLLTN